MIWPRRAARAVAVIGAAALTAACAGPPGDDSIVRAEPASAIAPDQSLTGTWTVERINLDHQLRDVGEAPPPVLTFLEGGTVVLRGTCTTADGSWSVDGDHLSVGELATVEPGCSVDGDEPAADQAIRWLVRSADRVDVVGDTLTLFAADGSVLVIAQARG